MQTTQIIPQDEWLRPKDVQRLFKIGHNKFYQYVRDGAFPVSKPDPKGRAVFILRSDVERFFRNGYKNSIAA